MSTLIRSIPETPEANNRRRALALLRAGGYVQSVTGTRYDVWSPRQGSGHSYEVHRLEDGSVVTWTCDAHCEHTARHGEHSIFNGGTQQVSTNGVRPCAHVLLAMIAAATDAQRAKIFNQWPELGAAWATAQQAVAA